MFAFATLLDRAGGPLYRQAADKMRSAIIGGGVAIGAELPREAVLAEQFGISLITVRHALRELESEGLIRKRAAKAAVVARVSRLDAVPRDLNSLDDIVAATRDASLEISSYAPRNSAEAAGAFGLTSGTMLPCLRGRLFVRDKPFTDLTIFFPPAIGARMTRADFDDVVVFRSLERKLGIRLAGARITVAAERASAALAKRLNYGAGLPVLVNRMLYLDTRGEPVELTIARHRADRYRLTYAFHGAR